MIKSLRMINDILEAIDTIKEIKELYKANEKDIQRISLETNDLLHFIELNNYDTEQKLYLYDELKRARQARRRMKEENERLKPLYDLLKEKEVFGDEFYSNLRQKLKELIPAVEDKIDLQDSRKFTPRIRTDLEGSFDVDDNWRSKLKKVLEG